MSLNHITGVYCTFRNAANTKLTLVLLISDMSTISAAIHHHGCLAKEGISPRLKISNWSEIRICETLQGSQADFPSAPLSCP